MNILFFTLLDFNSLQDGNIYTDLLGKFYKCGHNICVVSPIERRKGQNTYLIEEEHLKILKLRIGNIQKTNILEKGVSTLSVESIFIRGIKKYLADIRFDLIIYSTPPITFCKAVDYVKKRDKAQAYLLLKDIFPQNAVDIGMMSKNGVKGILYKFFREKEKKLYAISDYIGCMSQANVDYIIKHNREITPKNVEICPNSVEVTDKSVKEEIRVAIRKKYEIPLEKKVFIYGGNLGKPQGIDFLIRCIRSQKDNKEIYFLIVGDGTEYSKLEAFVNERSQDNVKLMRRLPRDEYDTMVGACDVGMIFLDHRFTIPNFPSRILSYMQAKIPVLACTDKNTDIGKVIVESKFGWWSESKNVQDFSDIVKNISEDQIKQFGLNGYQCLKERYSVEQAYDIIMNRVGKNNENYCK